MEITANRKSNVNIVDLLWWHHWQRQMCTLYRVRWWHYLPFSISFHFSSDDINGTFYLLWNEHTHVLHPRLVAMILALWLSWKNFSMSGRKCVPGVPIELKYLAQFNHWACSTNIYFMFQIPTQMNEWMQRSLVKISVSQNLEINYIHKLAPH